MTDTTADVHYFSDGSGTSVEGDRLTVWDSHDNEGVISCRSTVEARNYYTLWTEYPGFDITGELATAIDALYPPADSEPHEIAYAMTYAGHGMEDVSWRRLGELLVSHPLAEVFEILGVDLEVFRIDNA